MSSSGHGTGFASLVTATLVVTAAANLSPMLVSALAVQIQDDLGIGEAEIGMTVSAFFFVGALTSALSGRMVERIGPAAGLRLSTAVAGAVLVVTGALGRSWPALPVLVGLAGLANSLGQPAANLYVARGISSRRQGLALGIQKSGNPAASLLAGLAIPTVGLTIGWSWAFVLGGLLAFGVTLGVPAAGRTPPGAGRGGAATDRPPVRPRPDVAVRLLIAVTCSTCLAAMGSMALSSFFVLSSVETGVDEAAAGILLMAGSVVGIASRLALGAGADRASLSPLDMLTAMFAAAALAFVGLSTGSEAMLYAAMPFAFATSFAWPGLFHLAMVRQNPSAPGAATGITLTGNLAGAVCGPLLFGLLVEATSYGWAWSFAAITSGAAAALMAVTSRLIAHRTASGRG
ncbi:MAG: MFS transporter [Acidimicrobiaceae bacterium]|nr:MFS transporter [Acidimicrobiaceae bacterium]MYE97749.1 MFS transporter [Acidimicrobiaceae bacterium]MYI53233.1 MFS transporter [Acidimicrobiaceae bacterium]MYJ81055.1 MFS transporter [Acidimicrobiaceae bacterium]